MIDAQEKPVPRIDVKRKDGSIVQIVVNGPKSAMFLQKAMPAIKALEASDDGKIEFKIVDLTSAVNLLLPEDIGEELSIEHYMEIFKEALAITMDGIAGAGKSSEKKSKSSAE
jgi:hypothetical protein